MKSLFLSVLMAFGMFFVWGCSPDEEISDNAPEMSEAEFSLCSTVCAGMEGQDWSDCVAEECGPTGGGGDGGGGGGGGTAVTCQNFPGYPLITRSQCVVDYDHYSSHWYHTWAVLQYCTDGTTRSFNTYSWGGAC